MHDDKEAPRSLAETYRSVIEQVLGLVATIDEDGDVVFRHLDAGTMFIDVNATHDPEFFNLKYSTYIEPGDFDLSFQDLVAFANEVNLDMKAIKMAVRDRQERWDISFSIESCLAAPDQWPERTLIEAIVGRCVRTLCSAAKALSGRLEPVRLR